MLELKYLDNAGVDANQWWEKFMNEDEGYGYMLHGVVSFSGPLPNLKMLRLPHRWDDAAQFENPKDAGERLLSTLDAIVNSSNAETDHEKPLRKLDTVLPLLPGAHDQWAGLQCLQPFCDWKASEKATLENCVAVVDEYTGIPFRWRSLDLSPISRVELAFCYMNAEGKPALLSHTPSF